MLQAHVETACPEEAHLPSRSPVDRGLPAQATRNSWVAEACLKAALAIVVVIAIGVLFGSEQPRSAPEEQVAAEALAPGELERVDAQLEQDSSPTVAAGTSQWPTSRPASLTSGPAMVASPSPSATIRAAGAPTCKLGDSFTSLVRAVGESAVGRCLEDEYVNLLHGDTHQRTSRGMLVWRKDPGVAIFDDGTTRWYGCPRLVVRRASQEQPPC
jgi:hypothetical protein